MEENVIGFEDSRSDSLPWSVYQIRWGMMAYLGVTSLSKGPGLPGSNKGVDYIHSAYDVALSTIASIWTNSEDLAHRWPV